jgi:hypothetical protein
VRIPNVYAVCDGCGGWDGGKGADEENYEDGIMNCEGKGGAKKPRIAGGPEPSADFRALVFHSPYPILKTL